MDKSRVSRRRATFFSLIFLLTSLAAWFMADLLWQGPINLVDLPLLALFTILFANITTGFCTALLGLYVINRGDTARITRTIEGEPLAKLPLGGTAIVMPVFNEDPSRIFEGLRVIYRSLEQTGRSTSSISSSSAIPTTRTAGSRRRSRGPNSASSSTASGGFSTGSGASPSQEERQRRRLPAPLGDRATATWSCSTPTAS